MRYIIPELESWPRKIAKRKRYGYKVWALQNKKEGHCIYNCKIMILKDGSTLAFGMSETELYGHGSEQWMTDTYNYPSEFMDVWGLK